MTTPSPKPPEKAENKSVHALRKSDGTRRRRPLPILRFSPTAWAKLHFFCQAGETEIGGFGISAEEDPLYIEDFATLRQFVTPVSVTFDDESVADFFDDQVDQGRPPGRFSRIWCHTHPGSYPLPSGTDEETFERVFGGCDWAIMFILAREGQTYARLRFNAGPGGDLVIPVQVDYDRPFAGSDHESWRAEYETGIVEIDLLPASPIDRAGWSGDALAFGAGRGDRGSRHGELHAQAESFIGDEERSWREIDLPALDADTGSPARRRRPRRRPIDIEDLEVSP